MQFIPLSKFDADGPKSTLPIWAINTVDQSRVGQAGEVLLGIPKPNGTGQPDRLVMPQTWLPQEVTRNIPRRRLLNSTEFRNAVNDGLISLISQETAEKLLRQNGATEEKARLTALAQHIHSAGAARTIADSKAEITRADGIVDDDDEDSSGRNKVSIIDSNEKVSVAKLAANGVEDDEPGITPQFRMWAERLNIGDDMGAKNLIKGKSSFKKVELAFLLRVLDPKFITARRMVEKNLTR